MRSDNRRIGRRGGDAVDRLPIGHSRALDSSRVRTKPPVSPLMPVTRMFTMRLPILGKGLSRPGTASGGDGVAGPEVGAAHSECEAPARLGALRVLSMQRGGREPKDLRGVGERLVERFVDQCLGEVAAGTATGADAEHLGELVDILDTRGHGLANLAVLDGLTQADVHEARI